MSPGRRQDVKGGRRRRSFSSLPRRLAQWQPVRGLQFPRRGGHGGGTAGEHERGSRGGACRRQIIRGLRIMRPRNDGDRRNHAARLGIVASVAPTTTLARSTYRPGEVRPCRGQAASSSILAPHGWTGGLLDPTGERARWRGPAGSAPNSTRPSLRVAAAAAAY